MTDMSIVSHIDYAAGGGTGLSRYDGVSLMVLRIPNHRTSGESLVAESRNMIQQTILPTTRESLDQMEMTDLRDLIYCLFNHTYSQNKPITTMARINIVRSVLFISKIC